MSCLIGEVSNILKATYVIFLREIIPLFREEVSNVS
jgi:hypothetical protein